MTFSWRTMAAGILVVMVFCLFLIAGHYRSEATEQSHRADRAVQLAGSRLTTITAMQKQQHDVAAIDAKYTQELNDAKQTIADLQRDVASGAKRLRVNATCQRVPSSASSATTASLADGAGPQLTPDAERAYWRLRDQIVTAEKQIAGLQEYIRSNSQY